ncbi:hypothetical protein PtrSN002B_002533 [Pyrenophora tritici-repentis]|uniref:Uncharacterized protein n=2 Tax=Pyrenophora tritici-repentis TaxID=45151 RepID=A0A2W1ELQ7_9PLEO|nr:uncharacterized protein PTRG_08419 [Pyrenophora tritici-repentis Pt-1C-BFP]KAA8615636.1 hypothetical protein PtrV1_11032 [Pyrenophora tritici-repentis]EDU51338.1 predicted protein [Pyrenophora tritici-repentis Pt-1C-BFP]KAF7443782.1 hypothetical protein A1F99_118560 [Pyrenophora tritici-repentis]KAF7566494.1 hypothetical protein PtrM4_148140 [Pyrenophora tritici-repentis]KAG9379517.1 hypothetical protein A1F94_009873 [Pyrenophora tritici-repentis]
MVNTTHSTSVRGTLSNPKTTAAKQSNKSTPSLGDSTSLKPERDDKPLPSNDSAPPANGNNDTPSSPSCSYSSSAPVVSDPYRGAGTSAGGGDKKAIGNGGSAQKEELPHSKTVRGTLANKDGNKVNRTQLGDPASLKAETSSTNDMDRQTEREGMDKNGTSKL